MDLPHPPKAAGLPMLTDHLLPVALPQGDAPLASAELLGNLLAALNDLDRLQRLLSEAGALLSGHFRGASGELKQMLKSAALEPDVDKAPMHAALDHLAGAITAMQFQDTAAQLVNQSTRRLRLCADRLASATPGDVQAGAVQPPSRSTPWT